MRFFLNFQNETKRAPELYELARFSNPEKTLMMNAIGTKFGILE
jgi:hypothetical protein